MADVGIGLNKSRRSDLFLLQQLAAMRLRAPPAVPQLIGFSRKRVIGWAVGQEPGEAKPLTEERLGDRVVGGLAAAAWCTLQGIDVIRTHDVRETRCARDVMMQIISAEAPVEPPLLCSSGFKL
eukprot:GHVT01005339.1.p2 GENE.GHVT01005339.1~~GHVT01005339.1.p2  ORF type:complete len:124 (+),score=32.51 GHVT01005339.1:134-505(+)